MSDTQTCCAGSTQIGFLKTSYCQQMKQTTDFSNLFWHQSTDIIFTAFRNPSEFSAFISLYSALIRKTSNTVLLSREMLCLYSAQMLFDNSATQPYFHILFALTFFLKEWEPQSKWQELRGHVSVMIILVRKNMHCFTYFAFKVCIAPKGLCQQFQWLMAKVT